jgi:hypothetical protein
MGWGGHCNTAHQSRLAVLKSSKSERSKKATKPERAGADFCTLQQLRDGIDRIAPNLARVKQIT